MYTFTESYSKPSFYYKTGVQAFKEYLMDILNTEKGTRPYYPDYGLLLEKYKYSLFTPSTAQSIHSDVYFVIASMDGVTISQTSYKMNLVKKSLELYFEIILGQEPIGLHLTYSDGGFK